MALPRSASTGRIDRKDSQRSTSAVGELDFDLVSREAHRQCAADGRAGRHVIGAKLLVVAHQPMLLNRTGSEILNLDRRADRGLPGSGRIGDHRCGLQQPLEARDPGSQDRLLFEGLKVVVVTGDLTKGPGLAQAGGEPVQLMTQAPQGGTQGALSLTGEERWHAWRRRIDARRVRPTWSVGDIGSE